MSCLLHILCVTLWLQRGLSFPPAPLNVYVDSHNFHHVLRWDPGHGTPPGTWYRITKSCPSCTKVHKKKEILHSNTTSLELQLDNEEEFQLTVQAVYNQTLSLESKSVCFTPFSNTKIGPSQFSLYGKGNSIQINISMPKPAWRLKMGLKEFYDPKFKILWRKAKENPSNSKISETRDKTFTLDNLEVGEEYCVQVDTHIRINKNTQPSTWKCTITSRVEPRTDTTVLGAVTALLILSVGVLMISMFCLYYTGFLGKLQATVPRALIVALHRGYTLTPETISTYQISDTSETENQRMHKIPTACITSHAANSDAYLDVEDEDEENETPDYMDRNAELSTDESSSSDINVSYNCKLAASEISGSSKERSSSQVEGPSAEFDFGVQEGLDREDCKTEGLTVSFMSEMGPSKVQGLIPAEQEDGEVKAYDSSGNVNLFSVTIAALVVRVDEEQNTGDTLGLYESETPVVRDSNLSLINADKQTTESDNQVNQRMHKNPTACITSHAATSDAYLDEEGEDEEENETPDYMHRNAELSTEESYKPAASENSGSSKERSSSQVEGPSAEFDFGVQEGVDREDCKTEGLTVSFMSEMGPSKVQGLIPAEQEDGEVKAYDSSGNVNLFSVTIAALVVHVDEEQNTGDTLGLYESETPVVRHSNLSLINADKQTRV